MLLKIIITVLFLRVLISRSESVVHNFSKLGNLTIKYGDTTEIRFEIKDCVNKELQSQLEALRTEQNKLFADLSDKLDTVLKSRVQPSGFPSTCAEATARTRQSGIYQISIAGYTAAPILVRCDEETQNGGWTVIMRRADGSVNFFRYWREYKSGFGNVNGEYFVGLDVLHAMTKDQDQELLILMEDTSGQKKFAKYDRFSIGSEKSLYALQTLGAFSGDAGDSLSGHMGLNFSTRDRDNDAYDGNCAEMYTGAWWYNKCHTSNLMGKYNDATYGKGINWLQFSGHTSSLKSVLMMIRPIQ